MKRAVDFLLGKCNVRIGGEFAEKALNAMMKKRLSHSYARVDEDGCLCFTISRRDRDLLLEIIDKCAISVYSIYESGLPCLFARYKRRWGILFGCAIFAFFIYVSGFFVWDVNVKSAPELDGAVIEERLRSLGFGTGTFRHGVDLYELCNSYLNTYDDCAWISVNIIGNIAYIEATPRVTEEGNEEDDIPRNLVAGYSGIIVSRETLKGEPVVHTGDCVFEGDLLVSGVVSDVQGDCFLCHSEAKVYAEIERTFTVSVPYSEETEYQSDGDVISKSLVIFGKEIPLSRKNTENSRAELGELCINGKTLPFALKTYREITDEKKVVVRSCERAESIAEYRISDLVSNELADAKILSITKEMTQGEAECTAAWTVRCICDIAVPSPIYTQNN